MTRRKAEKIGSVLNVCSFIGGFGLLFLGLFNIPPLEKLFSAIVILCFFAGLFFLLRYPEVFVAEMKKELQKKELDTKYESLLYPLGRPAPSMSTPSSGRNWPPATPSPSPSIPAAWAWNTTFWKNPEHQETAFGGLFFGD